MPSIPKDIDTQIEDVKFRLFPSSYLSAPDSNTDFSPHGGFPTNGDRFAAQELQKRLDVNGFTRKGFVLQAIAAGWHHKTPEQLREVGEKVGRERIVVLHGTEDRMITFPHGEILSKELGEGVEMVRWEGSGHALPMEKRKEFAELVRGVIERTKDL